MSSFFQYLMFFGVFCMCIATQTIDSKDTGPLHTPSAVFSFSFSRFISSTLLFICISSINGIAVLQLLGAYFISVFFVLMWPWLGSIAFMEISMRRIVRLILVLFSNGMPILLALCGSSAFSNNGKISNWNCYGQKKSK